MIGYFGRLRPDDCPDCGGAMCDGSACMVAPCICGSRTAWGCRFGAVACKLDPPGELPGSIGG